METQMNNTLRGRVRALPVGRAKPTMKIDRSTATSKALTEDPFQGLYQDGSILIPLDSPTYLASLPHYSPTLGPCIDVMAQNVDGFGYQLVPRRKPNPDSETEKAESEDERQWIEDFFNYVNPKISFTELRRRRRKDKELLGRCAIEVLRAVPDKDNSVGLPVGLEHLPAKGLRFAVQDLNPTLAKMWVYDSKTKEWKTRDYYQRFRRYAHVVNGKIRYFKEFGDPRHLNYETGKFFTHKVNGDERYVEKVSDLSDKQKATLANELIVEVTYDPYDVQGSPRWIGSKVSLESARKAEESALDYLDNRGIPVAFLLVQGGMLDEETYEQVIEKLQDAKGDHPENRLIVIEVLPAEQDAGMIEGGAQNTPKVEVVKLNDLQRGDDSMLLNFDERANQKVRRSFRFSDMYLGDNTEQSYATASVSQQIAEQQVFAPERVEFDWMINSRLLPELGATWWEFQTLGPVLEDNTTWIDAVRIGVEYGAIPDYQTLRSILSEALGYDLPSGDEDGKLAEWEQMPPGFVRSLLTAVQGFPMFADLENTLSGIVEPEGQNDPNGTKRARISPTIDSEASRVIQVMLRAREKLLESGGLNAE